MFFSRSLSIDVAIISANIYIVLFYHEYNDVQSFGLKYREAKYVYQKIYTCQAAQLAYLKNKGNGYKYGNTDLYIAHVHRSYIII